MRGQKAVTINFKERLNLPDDFVILESMGCRDIWKLTLSRLCNWKSWKLEEGVSGKQMECASA